VRFKTESQEKEEEDAQYRFGTSAPRSMAPTSEPRSVAPKRVTSEHESSR